MTQPQRIRLRLPREHQEPLRLATRLRTIRVALLAHQEPLRLRTIRVVLLGHQEPPQPRSIQVAVLAKQRLRATRLRTTRVAVLAKQRLRAIRLRTTRVAQQAQVEAQPLAGQPPLGRVVVLAEQLRRATRPATQHLGLALLVNRLLGATIPFGTAAQVMSGS